MNLLLSDSAVKDLEDIQNFYLNEGVSQIGDRFLSEIMSHIEILSDHPDIGRKVPEFDVEKIREIQHPPYRIVYVRDVHAIYIIRVWRSERLLSMIDTPLGGKI